MRNGVQTRVVKTEVVTEKSTGEVILQKDQFVVGVEPSYVKLYLDCLATFKGLRRGVSPFLMELLRYMTYANATAEEGGQIITISKWHRLQIAKRLGISDSMITKHLTQLVQAGILKRVANTVYQANPMIFGRGDWRDIEHLRATFDFTAGTVEIEDDPANDGDGEACQEREAV